MLGEHFLALGINQGRPDFHSHVGVPLEHASLAATWRKLAQVNAQWQHTNPLIVVPGRCIPEKLRSEMPPAQGPQLVHLGRRGVLNNLKLVERFAHCERARACPISPIKSWGSSRPMLRRTRWRP